MGKKKAGGGGGGGNTTNNKKKNETNKKNNNNKKQQQNGGNQGKDNQVSNRKQKAQEQHVDPMSLVNAALENMGEKTNAEKKNNKKQQQQQPQQQKPKEAQPATTPRQQKKKKGGKGAKNAAAPSEPQTVLVNGLEITEDVLKKLPKRKKGETKKQWYTRVGLDPEVDEDGNYVAHPPAAHAQRLDVNPGDYEEEAPEEDEIPSETNDDFSDTQNERAREYKKGGYHPVVVNELYNERYRVVHKLGWGYFSTVWLVWDYKKECFQAMKVQKSAQHYTEAAYDEIKLLDQIMKGDPEGKMCCARMTDSFEHKGPHGLHVCMLFDLLGENLLSLGERYENRGIPLPIVKSIAKETLIGLHHIHSLGIIHTDIKPENVLLSSPKHKIHSLMRRYKAPPMGDRPALLERDVRTMTKSQRRRYYQKKAKQQAAKKEDEEGETAATADPDVEGKAAAATNDAKKAATDGADSDATVSDIEAEEDKKAADREEGAEDSETDQEWEVERFHHVSLADFGNSCWIDLQFTDEVQTRQYRAPEVIIGDPYSTPIDLWSAAAMFFELLTGEFLFDPKASGDYPRDEDHLALISELMGDLPDNMSMGRGKYRAQFYNSRGKLRHINELRYWSLKDVLHDKYRYTRKKAYEIASFLEPMLELDPQNRATAEEMLIHFEKWFEVQEDDYSPLCFVGEHDDDDADEEFDGAAQYHREDDEDDDYSDEEEEDEEEVEENDGAHADGEDDDEDKPRSVQKKKKKTKGSNKRSKQQQQRGGGARHSVEDDLAWFEEHECLQPDNLAAVGLTIEDIKEVLEVGQLEDPDKDEAAQDVLKQLLAKD